MRTTRVLTLLAAPNASDAHFFWIEGEDLCNCGRYGESIPNFSECVAEAVTWSLCVSPNYWMSTRLDIEEYCAEAGTSSLLLSNPKAVMHLVNGIHVDYNHSCKIISIHLGHVPNDRTVREGAGCATFRKTKELVIRRPIAGLSLDFDYVDAAEGNAFLITGEDCRFSHSDSTQIFQTYGLLE